MKSTATHAFSVMQGAHATPHFQTICQDRDSKIEIELESGMLLTFFLITWLMLSRHSQIKDLPHLVVEVIVLSYILRWCSHCSEWCCAKDYWIVWDILKIENHSEYNPQIQWKAKQCMPSLWCKEHMPLHISRPSAKIGIVNQKSNLYQGCDSHSFWLHDECDQDILK